MACCARTRRHRPAEALEARRTSPDVEEVLHGAGSAEWRGNAETWPRPLIPPPAAFVHPARRNLRTQHAGWVLSVRTWWIASGRRPVGSGFPVGARGSSGGHRAGGISVARGEVQDPRRRADAQQCCWRGTQARLRASELRKVIETAAPQAVCQGRGPACRCGTCCPVRVVDIVGDRAAELAHGRLHAAVAQARFAFLAGRGAAQTTPSPLTTRVIPLPPAAPSVADRSAARRAGPGKDRLCKHLSIVVAHVLSCGMVTSRGGSLRTRHSVPDAMANRQAEAAKTRNIRQVYR